VQIRICFKVTKVECRIIQSSFTKTKNSCGLNFEALLHPQTHVCLSEYSDFVSPVTQSCRVVLDKYVEAGSTFELSDI